MRPLITLVTDLGPVSTAVCRGVIIGICPDARVVEINHEVTPFSVLEAAHTLVLALPSFPLGVHVVVVDPGVGTDRRALALKTGRGDVLIGPDNGSLIPALDALGGLERARSITNTALMQPVVSASFHGRDVFSPVAAHLAAGIAFENVGPPIPAGSLKQLAEPRLRIGNAQLETAVTHINHFGNVMLAGGEAELEAALGPLQVKQPLVIEFGAGQGTPSREVTSWQRTFGDVPIGASLLLIESEGQLSFADNRGNVAKRLGLTLGQTIRILPADGPGQ